MRDEAEALLLRELIVRREMSDHEARVLLNEALATASDEDDPQALWTAVLEGTWIPAAG